MQPVIAVRVGTNLSVARNLGAAPDSFKKFLDGRFEEFAGGEEISALYREYRRWYMKDYRRLVYPRKSKQIKLTLSLEEHRALVKDAGKSRSKTAVHAKKLILSAMTESHVLPDEKQVKALETQIRRIGNNINQVATAVNSGKGFGKFKFKYLENQLAELDRKIDKAFRKPENLVVFAAKAVDKNPALIPRLRAMLDKAEAYFKDNP